MAQPAGAAAAEYINCKRLVKDPEKYEDLKKCYSIQPAQLDDSNQNILTLQSITEFNKSDTHHDYGNLAGIEEIKYFAPDPTLVTPGSMSEETTYQYANTMVGVNSDNAAYTCTPILMAYGENAANGECLYTALANQGITDPVFIVDVIKSTVFGAMSYPPLSLGEDFPVLLQTTSTLCDPGPKRTRPRGDLFPGGGAVLKWGYSPGNMMYPAWQTLRNGYIERDLMARDTGSEIPYALGINTKAFQILLNASEVPQNHKAAVVIIDPNSLGSPKRKIYYLEKDHTTKKVKAFRDSAFLNGIKNSFKPVKVVVENAIREGGPLMLNDLSLAANVLGKRMGDGCQCLQASMNNLSWIHNDIAQSGGTAGLVTYDKNCAAYALEVGAPFVIFESYAGAEDNGPVWCNLLTRNAFKDPMAQLESTVKYAEKVSLEYAKIIASIPSKESIVNITEFLISFPDSLDESNESIQKDFTDYLTLLNNAIPKIVNQNNFNNEWLVLNGAIPNADRAMQNFNEPILRDKQLIDSLKKKQSLSEEDQAKIPDLVSKMQASIATISSFNEKAKTTIELHELVKATGEKGDKIISDSIGEIKLAELVKPPARRSRMAACKSMLKNFVNKIRRKKTNSFLNDATLLTGAGSVIGPLYRILVNVNPVYANELLNYANKIYDHFSRQAAEQVQPDLVQVFNEAQSQLELINQGVPPPAGAAGAGLGGGGRGAAVAPQMYGGFGESIDELVEKASKGENIVAYLTFNPNVDINPKTLQLTSTLVENLTEFLVSQNILNNIIITVNGILSAYEYSWVLSASVKPDNLNDKRFEDPDRFIDPEIASNPTSVQEYLNQITEYLKNLEYTEESEKIYAQSDSDIVIYDNEVVDIQSRLSNPFDLYKSLSVYSEAIDEANLSQLPVSKIPAPFDNSNVQLMSFLAKVTKIGESARIVYESAENFNKYFEHFEAALNYQINRYNSEIRSIEEQIKAETLKLASYILSELTQYKTRLTTNTFKAVEYGNFCTQLNREIIKIQELPEEIDKINEELKIFKDYYTAIFEDIADWSDSGFESQPLSQGRIDEKPGQLISPKQLNNLIRNICDVVKYSSIGTLQGELKQLQQDKQTLINTLLQNEEELVKSRSELDQKNSDLQKNLKELESLNEKIGKERITEVPAAAAAAVAPIMANVVSRKRSLDEVDPAVERTRSGKRLDPGTTIFIEEKIESLNNEIAQLNENIKELEGQIEALSGQMQELEGEIQLKNTEIVAEQDKALETINKMIDNLNNRFFPPKMDKLGGGKRRTMKNKSKSKRNAKNQTHRKRRGKAVGKRTATAHRPKTARNAKKITKKSTSNTKTKRSAKPAKKRAINRRARNARKDRK